MATDTPIAGGGSIQFLEVRHRAHARVEDRIRTGKDSGFGRFPSRVFAINAAWLELALTGIDLLAWTQHLLLSGDLALGSRPGLRVHPPGPRYPHRSPDQRQQPFTVHNRGPPRPRHRPDAGPRHARTHNAVTSLNGITLGPRSHGLANKGG